MFDESVWLAILIVASLANILCVGLSVWARIRDRKKQMRLFVVYYKLLSALGSAAKKIDEFAAEDHRTLDSLGAGMFSAQRSGADNARMRGLEVYRNGYVEGFGKEIREHLDEYNHAAGQLLTELDENPDNYRA